MPLRCSKCGKTHRAGHCARRDTDPTPSTDSPVDPFGIIGNALDSFSGDTSIDTGSSDSFSGGGGESGGGGATGDY